MPRKIKTIYDYFLTLASEQEINEVMKSLSEEDKQLLKDRFGDDLYNPIKTENWNSEKSYQYYKLLLPKIKKKLINYIKEKKLNIELEKKQNQIKEENNNKQALLLQLIKDGKSNNELCERLNISHQELYNLLLDLKNKGYMISRKYYSNGLIKYSSEKNTQLLNSQKNIEKTIITDTNEDNVKFLVISDLHFGNELERLDLIDRAYNYCINNNINIIICCGDIIDGTYSQGKQKITNVYEQIEYFIKNYPYDKNILTFGVAGDHDISALYNSSLNLIETCNNYRHDIIIGGFNNTLINLKNDKVLLFHHIEYGNLKVSEAPVILHGHSHKYSTKVKDNKLNIMVPSLSDIIHPMPTALELNIYFNKGYIVNLIVKQVYFENQDIILNESTFNIQHNKTINNNVKNVENFFQEFGSECEESKKTHVKQLSQIEKFNLKYGKQK